MKISYAITVCNELNEVQKLISLLQENKRNEDEIVVLYDSTNGSKSVEEYLRAQNVAKTSFIWHSYKFDGHFANLKNHLTSLCSGDYIFQIDADELVEKYFIDLLPQVLGQNDVDVILVPRINTVEGLTPEHIQKWGWRVDENNWINFPDFQWRIYKNHPNIKWKNKVHEVLEGYETLSHFPQSPEWCILHPKTIERQEKQNNYYNTL
jgi:hypothetical protein